MADMTFAGIPMEGSGVRALDADLYGAEQQAADLDNISATGNLNIGMVVNYDEHAQRHMNGGNLADGTAGFSAAHNFGTANGFLQAFAGESSDALANVPGQKSADTLINNFSPSAFNLSFGHGEEGSGSFGTSQAPSASGFDSSAASSVSSIAAPFSPQIDNSAVTNATTNTINNNGGGGQNLLQEIVNTVNNTLNNTNSTLDHIIDTVTNTATNTVDHLLDTVTHVVDQLPVTGLLEQAIHTTENALNNTSTTLNNLTNGLPDTLSNTLGGVVNQVTNLVDGANLNLGPLQGVTDMAENALSNLAPSLGTTLNNILGMTGGTENGLLGGVTNILNGTGTTGDTAWQTVDHTLSQISPIVDNSVENLSAAVENSGSAVVDSITSLLTDAANGSVDPAAVPGMLLDTAGTVGQQIAPVVDGTLGNITNVAGDAASTLLPAATGFANGVVSDVTGALGPVGGIDTGLVQTVTNTASDTANAILDAVPAAPVAETVSTVSTILDAAASSDPAAIGGAVASAATNTLTDAANTLSSIAAPVSDLLTDTASSPILSGNTINIANDDGNIANILNVDSTQLNDPLSLANNLLNPLNIVSISSSDTGGLINDHSINLLGGNLNSGNTTPTTDPVHDPSQSGILSGNAFNIGNNDLHLTDMLSGDTAGTGGPDSPATTATSGGFLTGNAFNVADNTSHLSNILNSSEAGSGISNDGTTGANTSLLGNGINLLNNDLHLTDTASNNPSDIVAPVTAIDPLPADIGDAFNSVLSGTVDLPLNSAPASTAAMVEDSVSGIVQPVVDTLASSTNSTTGGDALSPVTNLLTAGSDPVSNVTSVLDTVTNSSSGTPSVTDILSTMTNTLPDIAIPNATDPVSTLSTNPLSSTIDTATTVLADVGNILDPNTVLASLAPTDAINNILPVDGGVLFNNTPTTITAPAAEPPPAHTNVVDHVLHNLFGHH